RRPVAKHLADWRPAARVAGDARRAGSYQGRNLFGKSLDDAAPRIARRDSQNHLRRRRDRGIDSRRGVTGAETLDIHVFRLETSAAKPLPDHLPAMSRLHWGLWAGDNQHASGDKTIAISRRNFISIRGWFS